MCRVFQAMDGADELDIECRRHGLVLTTRNWTTGTSVSGDDIWYLTRPNPSLPQYQGYVAGWYLTTGRDPNPSVGHC